LADLVGCGFSSITPDFSMSSLSRKAKKAAELRKKKEKALLPSMCLVPPG
jgi:hypothetical protein